MKQFVIILFVTLCSAVNINAQTYLEHIQKKVQGEGTVTVSQSKEIDELINGSHPQQQNSHPQQQPTKTSTDHTKHTETPVNKNVSNNIHKESVVSKENYHENKVSRDNVQENKKERESKDEEFDIPTVNLRKKVMRGSYKVTGYRVQAFAGGNSRVDRQKAESIGNAIKMKFPEQPVYVHFYSPRWICRVGNFRSYSQAEWMLKEIRKMGYHSACLVKGKITVQK
jgi:hypothetical protein